MRQDRQRYMMIHGRIYLSMASESGAPPLFLTIRIVNLYADSYLRQTSAKAENEKKDKYFQPGVERRRSFTPMVYSADVINRTEAVAVQQCLASLLSNKLKQEYLEMCGFVRDWM